jgi:NADPH:quinone reductase-like Zn-dependent oxidoreductase
MPKLVSRLFGETPKSILGHEFAGDVVSIGEGVTDFDVGERVFGTTSGLRQGSHAEAIVVPADGMLTSIPPNISHEEAAPVAVGAMAALHFLQYGRIGVDKRVLINGASGSVGTFAVQIAKSFGAHVTGVSSTSNLELVQSLGADQVIDYTRQDFTESGEAYDLIFDAVGKTSPERVREVLADDGAFVTTQSRRDETIGDLLAVKELLQAGAVTAVVDRRFTLEQIPEAHRYVERGHKRGNVLIEIGD